MSNYLVGIDLGQTNDFTALVVLEASEKESVRHFAARHIERLPVGTTYPAQVARVKALNDRLKVDTGIVPSLVVDQTGVGRPVVDMLRTAGLLPAAVSIHGGDAVSRDGHDYRVPKRDLVRVVELLLQSKRLTIARALPEAETLTSELVAFKYDMNARGHLSYGNDVGSWRESPHDDLVLAVALACWYGETHKPVPLVAPVSEYQENVWDV